MTAFFAVACSLALGVIGFLVYKWLNPGKKLPPGPCGLPLVGYLPFFEKEAHKQFYSLSKKYGENVLSVRLGPSLAIILNEYRVAKEVLSDARALDRHPDMFAHVKERGFFSNNGPEWSEQRKFCMQSAKHLGMGTDLWEKMVEEEIQALVSELSGLGGAAVPLTDRLSTLASNNVISLLIGRRLDTETEEDKQRLMVDFMGQSMGVGLAMPVTLIPKLRQVLVFLRVGIYYAQQKTISLFRNFVNEEIRRHRTQEEQNHEPDFVDMYLQKMEEMRLKSTKHYFTDDNLEGNINVLFLGGSDTISTSLDWLLRVMAVHQDVQKKVQDEIDAEFGRDGHISYSERKKLPYTMAVLMENQRYSSVIAFSPNRQAVSDIEVNGYTIPKGSHIIANLWALHHDPNYWEEPEVFRPERFLSEDKKTYNKNLPSFGPFSFGRRNCPGEKIAYTEMLLVFTSLIRRFRIIPPPSGEVSFEAVEGLVAHLKPQPLRFVDRLDEDSKK